jgi:hypothetical protein
MVYPPPPPGDRYDTSNRYAGGQENGGYVSLPLLGSWAPPAVQPFSSVSPHVSNNSTPTLAYQSGPNLHPSTKRGTKRSPNSDESEEVEAGFALVGLGGIQIKSKAKRVTPGKKVKTEDKPNSDANGAVKKVEKDGKKSCSECRRLKAKCDRVFPCSNCELRHGELLGLADGVIGRRRGCALVCPEGDLSCMQGKRLVLASTEQLHDRVS